LLKGLKGLFSCLNLSLVRIADKLLSLTPEVAMVRQTISMEKLDGFSVDEETNQLYWRDKAVVTVFAVPDWAKYAALAGGFGGGLSALVNLARLFMGR
jgi:hypothetical protein